MAGWQRVKLRSLQPPRTRRYTKERRRLKAFLILRGMDSSKSCVLYHETHPLLSEGGSLTMVAHKTSINIEQAPFLILTLTLSALLNQVSLSENWLLFDCSGEKFDS